MMVASAAPSAPPMTAISAIGKLLAQLHMALAGIGERRGSRAEDRLHLVGAERLQRRNAGDQHGGHGDQPAAAGNGIDKTGKESGGEEQKQQMKGDVLQGEELGGMGCVRLVAFDRRYRNAVADTVGEIDGQGWSIDVLSELFTR